MIDLGSALDYDELEAIAGLLRKLTEAGNLGVGFSTNINVYDSNGDIVGLVSNQEGFHAFYPGVELQIDDKLTQIN